MSLLVDAPFTGSAGTLLPAYVDALGNSFVVPYLASGFSDINYALISGGKLSGYKPAATNAPGGLDDRKAYVDLLLPANCSITAVVEVIDFSELALILRAEYPWAYYTPSTPPQPNYLQADIFFSTSSSASVRSWHHAGGPSDTYDGAALGNLIGATPTLKFEAIGSTVKLYLNDTVVITHTTDILAEGYAGFSLAFLTGLDNPGTLLLDSYSVETASPSLFWQDFTKTQEILPA